MAYVPYAPEIAAKYNIQTPDGTIASFNDPTDGNYCGILSDVTGLDSADVRESADVLVQTDGGWHGNFWYGRRPITISGVCVSPVDAADRAVKLDKIRRATNAMRVDATLTWLNNAAGSVQMQTTVRRQQPVRFTGGWNKNFQIMLVSQFAPLFSSALHVVTGSPQTVENQGDYPSAPIIRITGASTNPVVTNTTTGLVVKFTAGFTVAVGHYVDIDILNHTLTLDGTTNIDGNLDFVLSTWPALIKGMNTYTLTGGGTLQLTYRDTWT